MCSPVLGSEPDHSLVLPWLRASAISGVPGERKAVRSELEKRIWPLASRNGVQKLHLQLVPGGVPRYQGLGVIIIVVL